MAASNGDRIVKPKLLIGEGREELRFFRALLKQLELRNVQVFEYGGKNKLSSYLNTLPALPGYSSLASLGVTRDADDSAENAFRSIQDALRNAGLDAPESIEGAAGNKPQVRAFVLPDNESPGMLEDLCLRSVQNDRGMKCVDDFMKCVVDHAKREPSPDAKARVHAWLASQDRPDLQLGVAAESGIWPLGGEAFTRIGDFLRSL